MEEKVKGFIEKNKILQGAESIVIAVSGGADSMALCYFMAKQYPQYKYIVAHVNHGLRKESQDEAIFVEEFAKKNGLAFICQNVDVASLAKERKIGVEEAGRNVRYDFFHSLKRDLILTAHHLDDDAETILAHLIRGTALKGLSGIHPKRGSIGRPFLAVGKEELLTYCEKKNIPYIHDTSNDDTTYMRNKIRHEVIPLLQSMNPNITTALCRMGNVVLEEEQFLTAYTEELFNKNIICIEDGFKISREMLFTFPKNIQRRILQKGAYLLHGFLDYENTEKILLLKTGKEFPLGKQGKVIAESQFFCFLQKKHEMMTPWIVSLPKKGITALPFHDIFVLVTQARSKANKDNCGVFCIKDMDDTVVLRNRRKGDWFYLSSGKRKKLSDFFIDEKVPKEKRDKIILLAKGNQILWIVGYRQCIPSENGEFIVKIIAKNQRNLL